MKIFKYALELKEYNVLSIPRGARILNVQEQHGVICLWAVVNPEEKPENRTFCIVGTGNEFETANKEYIGTVHSNSGYVWHIFEVA